MALDDYGYYDENGKFIKFKARKYSRKGSKTYHVAPDFSWRPRAIGSDSAMRIIWESAGEEPTATLSGEPYLLEDVKLRADPENFILSAELSDYMDRRASGVI